MDRRFLLGVALMVLIALAPSVLFKKQPKPVPAATPPGGSEAGGQAGSSPVVQPPAAAPAPATTPLPLGPSAPLPLHEDTIPVSSGLYRYSFSTRGGRLIQAVLDEYHPTVKGQGKAPLALLPADGALFDLAVLAGNDTLHPGDWTLAPSVNQLDLTAPATITFTGGENPDGRGRTAEITYRLHPDGYQLEVSGQITGVGPNGGMLLVGLGHGLRNTEADSANNAREFALVTRQQESKLLRLQSLDAGETRTLAGPFEWVGLKSKYFVAAVLAGDEPAPRISGAVLTALPIQPGYRKPTGAQTWLSLPLGADGRFSFEAYVGPMEFKRLKAMGHDFDDVNPYGWPGFRTVIRFFAAPVRWLLLTMHQGLGLGYGIVLIIFGILVKVVLWPLQAKAMRSSMKMQELQPEMKRLQTKYSADPAKLNTEMMALYKTHGVNPLGGCLPMLLPMPFLLALFVVFQYSIELRGAPFLWLTDLSQHDPYYVIPVVMGLSMYATTKVGQIGMPPNPQMTMMVYVMPAMMTFLFAQFPAGLNLYYAVQNIAGLPQSWMMMKERMKRNPVQKK
jgi:YidC/Oxa1 family membrane protein insertase